MVVLLSAFCLLGTLLRQHPVVGLLFDLLRWPVFILGFACGGYAFSRRAWRAPILMMCAAALMFGEWVHGLLTRADLSERLSGGGRVAQRLTVMTYNLQHEGGVPEMSLEALRSRSPQILALQEAGGAWPARLEREIAPRFAHRDVTGRGAGTLMLLSRYPLRQVTYVTDDDGHPFAQCAEVHLPNDLVLVCNVRLEPPTLPWQSPLALWQQFTAHAEQRRWQWNKLATVADQRGSAMARVIMGDFSMVEWDPLWRQVRTTYVDGFRSASFMPGFTFPALRSFPPLPLARVDFVFVRGRLSTPGADTLSLTGSSHRAVMVDLEL